MEDFVFGALATDDLKLVYHRAEHRGLQHNHAIEPRDPLPGEPVILTVQVGPDLTASQIACYYTTDGSKPSGSRGVAVNGQWAPFHQVDVRWDSLVWGYVCTWQCTLPAQPEGTMVRYRIGAWTDNGAEIFADWPDVKQQVEAAAAALTRHKPIPDVAPGDPSIGKVFVYQVDRAKPPDWAREAVIYHIVVDRFYPGDGRPWLKPADLRGLFGGTLWGVRDRLDYIADLGATCIWLSPIWPSPTHHGYDVTDYSRVELRLGGDEALHRLIEASHRRNIRVILDLVCNHLSIQHPYFQDALRTPSSPYRNWFLFDESEIGYRAYFGVRSMPEINLDYPDARRWMIEVGRYWLREFDLDGYRLDHANGPGPAFWTDFRAACRDEKPDAFCFGEVVEPSHIMLPYVGRLDGLLDFNFCDMVRRTYGYQTWSEAQLERFMDRHGAFFDVDNFLMPTFIDNHDMDRFLYIARNDKEALRQAATLQFQLAGPPIVYYGTEVGMTQPFGKRDAIGLEVSRAPMVWGSSQDHELFDFYRRLIRERREAHTWEQR